MQLYFMSIIGLKYRTQMERDSSRDRESTTRIRVQTDDCRVATTRFLEKPSFVLLQKYFPLQSPFQFKLELLTADSLRIIKLGRISRAAQKRDD